MKLVNKGLVLLLLGFPFLVQGGTNYPMPTLSQQSIAENFRQAEKGFSKRWKAFAHDKSFALFTRDFDDQDIMEQFAVIKQDRDKLYYEDPTAQPLRSNPEYERSQILLAEGLHKAPHLAAFEYNLSHPSYNSSNIVLNGHRFLALEGPQKPHHTDNFLMLLINYNVQKVVRLTNHIESGVFKSENYWANNLHTDRQGQQYLRVKIKVEESDLPYILPYFALDDWADNTGADPAVILNLISAVRADYSPGDLIAIHCSAGVGRTGTFIAGFILLAEIDRQLQSGISKDNLRFSIEELVYKLSMQRAYLVGQPEQYLTLHKLANLYLTKV